MEEKKYCKKIVIAEGDRKPSVYFALIVGEDEQFLRFRTKTKVYTVRKDLILKITDSDRIFDEGV